MWLTKLGLFASVSGLAVASGLNNFEYASKAGLVGALIAISADAFKFFAPAQIASLIDRDQWISALATISVWSCAVSFSLVAAISASSHQRHQLEQATPRIEQIDQRQPLQLAIAKIEAIKGIKIGDTVCGYNGTTIKTNGPTTRTHCPQWLALKRQLEVLPANEPTKTALTGKTIEANAISDFAALIGMKELSPALATLLMVYLWVLMVEFGSSFGGLAIQNSYTGNKT